jgi:hypothetical protein
MKPLSSAWQYVATVRGIAVAASLSVLLSSLPAFAQEPASPPTGVAPATEPPRIAQNQQEWRAAMSRLPMPKKGCFTSDYPRITWEEVPCKTAPARPYAPAKGVQPYIVGGAAGDFTAQVPPGTLSSAVGSFDSVTNVTSERDHDPNTYSLQLNTNTFATNACAGAKHPADCRGWQQFVYSTREGQVFMQYWLLNFGNCPEGFDQVGSSNCFKDSPAADVSTQPIADLAQLTLTGQASAGTDTVILTTGSGSITASNQDSVLDLFSRWNVAEFNVFGDGERRRAGFNPGSTIVVRLSVDNGTTNAPSCLVQSFTGETNNLNLQFPCATNGGASPAIVFTERFVGPPADSAPFVNVFLPHDQQHFAYLTDGEISDLYYCPGCDTDWQLQKINNGGVTNGAPAASAPFVDTFYFHDQQHFAYLARTFPPSGDIWDAYYCGGCSGDNKWRLQKINNGGVTNGPPAVSGPFVNTYFERDQQHFAYLAENGDIWDAYYCGGCSGDNKWRLQKINNGGVTNGPPAASTPFVEEFLWHDQQHFAYLTANGDIWDAYYCGGCSGGHNKWRLQKINNGGLTSGPPALAGPFVSTYAGHNQQHFAYLAANGEIWDAYYCPDCSGNDWQLQKINNGGVTDGPPAASAPFVNLFSGHDQQHFTYLAANVAAPTTGDIWDAYYCGGCSGGNNWRLQKINNGGVTDGPPAIAGPFVNTYFWHNQQHFAYLAAHREIWDAYYCDDCSGNKWRLQQLAGQ